MSVLIAFLLSGIIGCGGKSANKKMLSAEDQFAVAKKYYEDEKFFESAEEFQKVIYNYPGSNLIDTAQFYLANSYLEDEQFELAAVEFERLIKNYPRSDFGPDSRFLTGYSRYLAAPNHYGLDQTDLLEAIGIMNDFIIDYPESKMIPEARKALLEAHTRLAKKHFKSGMVYVHSRVYASALIYFQIVIDEYAETEFASLALLEKGKAQFKLLELEDAALTLNTFIAKYPNHKLLKKATEELKKVEKKLSEIAPENTAQTPEAPTDSLLQPTTNGANSAIESY
jgi:outer membrane protein assembly factor BamD